jgi:hypothetical protein
MRPPRILLIALSTALAFVCPAARSANFYVAPNGSDTNLGTLAYPFATLARAQQAVRSAKGFRRTPSKVFLRGGTYYLPKTFVLTGADSGTKTAPVVYQPYAQERPVISGGTKLNLKWEPYRDGIMKAIVPAGLTTDQLFINGKRQNMARYPNYDPTAQYFDGFAADAFSKERAARWADPTGGFIHAMHSALWGDYHYRITGKDAQGNVTYEGGWQNNRQMGMHPVYRFVENIFEELDAPGEWFLNRKTNTLYLYPSVGMDLGKATIEAVRLPHLIELRGDEKNPVRFLFLKGLTLRQSARTFMDNKEPILRSDWTVYRGGAVFFNGSEDCSLEDCVLDQMGGNSVFVNNYNRRVAIRGCLIENGGANGVAFFGDPRAVRSPLFEYNQVQDISKIDRTPGPKSNNYPADCIVDDCLITRTGRVEKQTAPVAIDMAQNITVSHCSIYDVPRAGINIGDGAWGGHVIEGCDVFDTVKETGDHGSFNSWGRDRFWRPDIEETNVWVKDWPAMPFLDVVKPVTIHDNRWRCDHGWDIDLDDGSSNYHIYNNLCLNGGIKNREGYRRIVENNVIVNNGLHPHVWYKNSGDIFRRNILALNYQPARMYPAPWGQEMDLNLLQRAGVTTSSPATELQRSSGRDEHSIVADALFVNPAQGDYRVQKDSPALALGFKNFPMNRFGVQKPSLRALARTPILPSQQTSGAGVQRDAAIRNWLGAKVRNIVGQGEMSAYGTPGETGVLIVELGDALVGSGLRKDDVILSWNDQKIDTTTDLLRPTANLKAGQATKIGIARTQQRSTVSLRITENILLSAGPLVTQTTRGDLQLNAAQAQIVGQRASLEGETERNIGNWTNAAEYLQWQALVQKPGQFDVSINYALNQDSEGSTVSVALDDQSLNTKLTSTGNWTTYRNLKIGSIRVSKAGRVTFTLKPVTKPGVAVMNLRSIVLVPVNTP